jgi:hypothetical protein
MGVIYSLKELSFPLIAPNGAHKAYFVSWALAKSPGGDAVVADKASIDLQIQSIFQNLSHSRTDTQCECCDKLTKYLLRNPSQR